jgi:uncharacterized protein (TIGR00297 family)
MPSPQWDHLIVSAGLFLAAYLAYRFNKLTGAAALTGAVIAIVIYLGTGYTGLVALVSFFLMGTLATAWKSDDKIQAGISGKEHEKRNASQVFANSGLAAIISLIKIFFLPELPAGFLVASCFSSAAADTLSSELGTVYGKRFYNILTLRNDKRGLDGVISLEGMLAGISASIAMGLLYFIFHHSFPQLLMIVLAGTLGNLADSFFGATLERKQVIKNDAVNFLNTLVAFLAGLTFYLL